MRKATTSILILAALVGTGCKTVGPLAKRESEKCCTTDIRKTIPWCAGEDALFRGPCEPNAMYYGYKPTCWGIWSSSGAQWRDTHCGHIHQDAVLKSLTHENPELIQLPPLKSMPEPAEDAVDEEQRPQVGADEADSETQGSLPEPPVGPRDLIGEQSVN